MRDKPQGCRCAKRKQRIPMMPKGASTQTQDIFTNLVLRFCIRTPRIPRIRGVQPAGHVEKTEMKGQHSAPFKSPIRQDRTKRGWVYLQWPKGECTGNRFSTFVSSGYLVFWTSELFRTSGPQNVRGRLVLSSLRANKDHCGE